MNEDKETPKPQPDPQADPRGTTGSGNSEPYSTLGSSPYPAFAAAPPSHPYPAFGRYSGLQNAATITPGEIEAREKVQRAQYERAEKIWMAFELVHKLAPFASGEMDTAFKESIKQVKHLWEAFPE